MELEEDKYYSSMEVTKYELIPHAKSRTTLMKIIRSGKLKVVTLGHGGGVRYRIKGANIKQYLYEIYGE